MLCSVSDYRADGVESVAPLAGLRFVYAVVRGDKTPSPLSSDHFCSQPDRWLQDHADSAMIVASVTPVNFLLVAPGAPLLSHLLPALWPLPTVCLLIG